MRSRVLAAVGVAALLAAACSSSKSSHVNTPGGTTPTTAPAGGTAAGGTAAGGATSATPLRLLEEAPLSFAPLQPNAQTAVAAAKAAVSYVNSHGGVLGHPVELTVVDDAGNPTTAVTKLESAINSGSKPAVFLQADASTEAAAELPILAQNKILSFNQAPTSSSGDPAKFPYNFDLSPSTANYASAFCPYVKSHGGSSVGILHGNDAYGDALGPAMAKACQDAGVKVTGTQQFELTALDMTPQLEALEAGHPSYLLLQAYGPPAGYVLQGLQKLGWNVPVLGDDSVMVSPVITSPPPSGQLGAPTEANLKCEVFQSTVYQANAPAPLTAMVQGMKAQGPIPAPLILAYMYDAVVLAAAGATKAGTTTDAAAIAKAIEAGVDAPTAIFAKYNFTTTSHSPNEDASAFAFVQPSKVVDGQFGAPGST
ncbi:MAG TPA: ABC transporter substrate-binding protein [Acidimicrobiales bacterium]|nr:ABC transporter substrate-binding protein [Acidimicrobiales bacterium]